ncbi:MAG: UbiX family flavin prenyltransferase [Deltaproteobacteria bacterium]|jgi:polyprenyl P-hydroxybenzoate/phenylacrylic acid decarboxylase-like protein|nr:UbiX family flavin prenyltransferase [Deltaproteobacteria bacterium]
MRQQRIIVGVSGASGMPVAVALLEALRGFPDWETHVILSKGAERVVHCETDLTPDALRAMASCCHDHEDIGASVASGTFRTEGMIIVPCSMKSLAGIACGYADNLLLRAADVCLKERRPLVLAVRETPLHAVHLANMRRLAQMGAIIMPLMMSFYSRPRCIEDMTRHMAGKLLDVFGLSMPGFRRWGE